MIERDDITFERNPRIAPGIGVDASGLAVGEDCPPTIIEYVEIAGDRTVTSDGTLAGAGNKAKAIDDLLPQQFE